MRRFGPAGMTPAMIAINENVRAPVRTGRIKLISTFAPYVPLNTFIAAVFGSP